MRLHSLARQLRQLKLAFSAIDMSERNRTSQDDLTSAEPTKKTKGVAKFRLSYSMHA